MLSFKGRPKLLSGSYEPSRTGRSSRPAFKGETGYASRASYVEAIKSARLLPCSLQVRMSFSRHPYKWIPLLLLFILSPICFRVSLFLPRLEQFRAPTSRVLFCLFTQQRQPGELFSCIFYQTAGSPPRTRAFFLCLFLTAGSSPQA